MFFLLNSGFLPDSVPIDHHAFIQLRGFRLPKPHLLALDWTDEAFLMDYGFYMDAIWNGSIKPSNPVQIGFCERQSCFEPGIAKIQRIWTSVCRSQLLLDGDLARRYRVYDAAQSWVPRKNSRSDWRRGLGA